MVTAPGGMEASTPRTSGLPGRLDHDDAGVSVVHRSRICGGLRPGSGCQANSEGWEPESDDSDPAEGCLVPEGIGTGGSCLRWLFDRIRFILLLVPRRVSPRSAHAPSSSILKAAACGRSVSFSRRSSGPHIPASSPLAP